MSRREFTQLTDIARQFIVETGFKDLVKLKKELKSTLTKEFKLSKQVVKYAKLSQLIETYLWHLKKQRIKEKTNG